MKRGAPVCKKLVTCMGNPKSSSPKQGTILPVSSLSPCNEGMFSAEGWQDWKAGESEESQAGGCPAATCSPSGLDEGLCQPGKYAYT
eukprot:1141879-Pelagomonas_calceolata.AAC.4